MDGHGVVVYVHFLASTHSPITFNSPIYNRNTMTYMLYVSYLETNTTNCYWSME